MPCIITWIFWVCKLPLNRGILGLMPLAERWIGKDLELRGRPILVKFQTGHLPVARAWANH